MRFDRLFEFRNPEQARQLQTELSSRVISLDDVGFNPRLFCGIDVSYNADVAHVAAAVWDMEERDFVERIHVIGKTVVDYFPGLLGFREGPLAVSISRRLRSKPDVFLIDGQGIAHPRRFGLASHFGIAIERPTIGVAKSRLYGKVEGDTILDSDGNVIGSTVAGRNDREFFVSVGHRISLVT